MFDGEPWKKSLLVDNMVPYIKAPTGGYKMLVVRLCQVETSAFTSPASAPWTALFREQSRHVEGSTRMPLLKGRLWDLKSSLMVCERKTAESSSYSTIEEDVPLCFSVSVNIAE